MGIPRKRSRKLTVHGRDYVYIVKETTIDDHKDQFKLVVTIQQDDAAPGRVMQFDAPYETPIGPGLVATAINEALIKGWDPTERGTAFALDFLGEKP